MATVTRGITVPVNVVPGTVSTTALTAATNEQLRGAAARKQAAEEAKRLAAAEREAAAAAAAHTRQLAQTRTGALSALASLVGLRGATLAATAPFLAGAAGAIAFSKALGTFAGFEQQLNVFAATTGATADEIFRVSEAAKALGRDITLPGVSAGDAAESMTEFAKAGLSVEDAMVAARGGLQLATAAQISNAEAVELAAGALNAFNLEGEDAVRVADVLANAANLAQGSITDTALALRQAAGAASVVGVSFEDTVALLTLLARNGLVGSDAGTALRTSFIRLVNPSKEANAILERLNITLRDANGNVRPEVYAEFAEAHRGLSRAVFQSNAAVVFGQDAFRAIGIFAKEGAVGLNQAREGMERTGTAAEIAGARTQGLSGSMENLKNQLTNTALVLGESFGPAVQGVVDVLALGVQATTTLAEKIGDLRAQAAQPIRFVIDFSGGDEEGGFADDVTTFLTGSLPDQIASATDNITDLRKQLRAGAADFEALTAQRTLPKLISDLNKTGASASKLDEVVRRLKELEEGMKGGSEETAGFRQRFSDFIADLQRLSQLPDIEIPIEIPADLLAGFPAEAEQGGKNAAERFGATFLPTLEQVLKQGTPAALSGGIDPGVQQFLASLRAQVASAFLATGAAASAVTDVEFRGGGDAERRAALAEQLQSEQKFVASLIRKREFGEPVKQARIDAAKQAATATQRQIDQIDEAAAREAEQRQRVREQQRNEQAQAFLDRLARQRQQQQNLIIAAGQTTGLADDIRRQRGFNALLASQIEVIKNSALTEKEKRQAIDALVTATIQTTGAIKNLKAAEEAQREANRQLIHDRTAENAALRTQIAEARGADRAVIVAFIDQEIEIAKAALVRARRAGEGILKAKLALENLRKKRRELLNQAKEIADDRFSGFEFLQSTQGFAANLLGNLIPGFATGGLVGNVSAVSGQITDPGLGFEAEVPTANQLSRANERGVRPVQVDTTNALLRQILASLNGRQTTPPEVQQNRRQSVAAMDTLGGV